MARSEALKAAEARLKAAEAKARRRAMGKPAMSEAAYDDLAERSGPSDIAAAEAHAAKFAPPLLLDLLRSGDAEPDG